LIVRPNREKSIPYYVILVISLPKTVLKIIRGVAFEVVPPSGLGSSAQVLFVSLCRRQI
jgi:hypothetical protein